MDTTFDINDFYIREYVCSGCGCICSKDAAACHVCGCQEITEETVARSCYELHYCLNRECQYVTQHEMDKCPRCGSGSRGCYVLIPEDHWGLPIPAMSRCAGDLKDDDEAYERSRSILERR